MKSFFLLLITIILSLSCIVSSAHSGRTDANGGHWDHSTGTYHYHSGEYIGLTLSTSKDYLSNSALEHYQRGYQSGLKAQTDRYKEGYTDGFNASEKKHNPKLSKFYHIEQFINNNFLPLCLIICTTLIIYNITLSHIRKIKSFRPELKCEGIARYDIEVVTLDAKQPKRYPATAEVMIYTRFHYVRNRFGREEIINSTSHYILHHFTWPAGHKEYLYEQTMDGYTSPEIYFNKEKILCDKNGKRYSVKLLYELTKLSDEQIKAFNVEKEKVDKKRRWVKKEIDRLLDDKTCQHKFFSNLFADYRYKTYMEIMDELTKKAHPAPKAAEEMRKLTKELKEAEKAYLDLQYKLNMYGIENVDDITLEDAKYLQAAQEYLKKTKMPGE